MSQTDKPEAKAPKSAGEVVSESFKELGETLVAFVKAPRALWGINIPYVIEGLAYFGILTILGKYCSENVALSDLHAGWVYSAVTSGITFSMLVLGGVTDKIGVRASLLISLVAMFLGRLLISFSGTAALGQGLGSPMFIMMSLGLLFMVVAYGLYQPAAYAGVKRYTNPQTAAMGYAVLYATMNLGAFIFGPLASMTRQSFETTFPPNGLTAVFWLVAILTLGTVICTWMLLTRRVDEQAVERVARETAELKAGGKLPAEEQKDEGALAREAEEKTADDKRSYFGRVLHAFTDKRFSFFIFVLIPVQTLFAHNWLTIPYYLDRAFVGTWVSDWFETLANLNPLLIFVFAPLVAGLTARANIYKMMIIGTLVMAAPTFLLALPPSPWTFIAYIVIMSIGEAMWQPRFLQWIAEIAPKGRTGLYMGIGQFPWFLTKFIVGLYSGYFLSIYIPKPESGLPADPQTLWFWYAVIAMVTPVALILARRWMLKGMKTAA
jgi:proton-dependent oligopeptide transporter, POT family